MGRAPCCDKNGLKKGPWTPEEDHKLIDYIQKHGYGNWRTLPKNAGLQRCGKSCRLRWTNYLRPDIKRGRFSFEEEETIIQLHSILGNKWSAIAARLPGRTDNEIKNYWNTHIRKRLLRMGIDPVTHSPRLDLLDLSSILGTSLYNSSHQMNMSRFLGFEQPLVNPELLRLATSLVSSQSENSNFLSQNGQENQASDLPVDNQFQSQVQQLPSYTTLTGSPPFVPISNNDQTQLMDQLNFTDQNPQTASSLTTHDCVAALSNYSSYNYGSDQTGLMDPSVSETTSNFMSNNSNQNFSFASVLSTPSSSPTPLNSTSTEDDNSYCSNMLKFEIPDFLDEWMSVISCNLENGN